MIKKLLVLLLLSTAVMGQVVLDATKPISSARQVDVSKGATIFNATGDGLFTGELEVGVDDTTASTVSIFGDNASVGGSLKLFKGDADDGSDINNYWQFAPSGSTLFLGDEVAPNDIRFGASPGSLQLDPFGLLLSGGVYGGSIDVVGSNIGINMSQPLLSTGGIITFTSDASATNNFTFLGGDTASNLLMLRGGTGTNGFKFLIYNADGEDTNTEYWVFEADGDDLLFGTEDDDDLMELDKDGNLSVLGSIDGIADLNTAVGNNTAKVTNADHSGDVAGSTVLTIAANAVEISMLDTNTEGDLVLFGGSGAPAVLGIGANNYILTSNGTTASWAANSGASGSMTAVIDDTTPELGGDLDLSDEDITGTGNIDITGNVELTGALADQPMLQITESGTGDLIQLQFNGVDSEVIILSGSEADGEIWLMPQGGAGAVGLRVDENYDTYISNGQLFTDGSNDATVPALSSDDDPDTGIWWKGPNQIAFATDGAERGKITNTTFDWHTAGEFAGDLSAQADLIVSGIVQNNVTTVSSISSNELPASARIIWVTGALGEIHQITGGVDGQVITLVNGYPNSFTLNYNEGSDGTILFPTVGVDRAYAYFQSVTLVCIGTSPNTIWFLTSEVKV